MPPTPVPADVDDFLSRPNPAVVATLRPDGSPHSAATWYDWESGRVLLNMDASRLRLQHMRRDPRAPLHRERVPRPRSEQRQRVARAGAVVRLGQREPLAVVVTRERARMARVT